MGALIVWSIAVPDVGVVIIMAVFGYILYRLYRSATDGSHSDDDD